MDSQSARRTYLCPSPFSLRFPLSIASVSLNFWRLPEQDKALRTWHGWHAFRRGLATNLYQLGVKDKDIQAILRHSNVGLTMNVYVKSVAESQVNAMDALGQKLETCNDLATDGEGCVN